MKRLLKNRLLRDQRGFTLVELLVTMVMMTIVMFALYSIFDMGIRVFSFGNDKVDVTENARIGLEKMEREIRAAYPYDKAASTPNTTLLTTWTANQIAFGNDLNSNRKVDLPSEEITYSLSGSSPPALLRNGQPLVENVKPGGLEFRYFKSNGVTPATSESEVAIVQIKLTVEIDRGSLGKRTQTLTTDVDLRNRTE